MALDAPLPPDQADRPPVVAGWFPWLAAALVAPLFLVKVKSHDVWWHMATGRWMVEHHRIPTTDPFTYTVAGKPWHLVTAISDLLLYATYRLGAETGLVLFKVIFVGAALGLLGLGLRELRSSGTTIAALTAAAGLLVHWRYTEERPMILGGVLLMGCQLAALRSLVRRDRSHLIFLAVIPLWPLVHGTATLGLAQLAFLLVACGVSGVPRTHLRSVAATLAGCLVLSALLPWWRELYLASTELGGGATATKFTAEWRTGRDALGSTVGHWMVLGSGVALGALSVRKHAYLLLSALTGAVIAWRFTRNASEGVLLAMPALAVGLERIAAWLKKESRALLAGAVAPLAAMAVASTQMAIAPTQTLSGPFGLGVDRALFPYDTLATLRRLPVHRLINGFPLGGFLIWENGPWGVYCDGRTVALYDEADVEHLFLPLTRDTQSAAAAADAWDAPYALVQNMSPPDQLMMLSPSRWTPLHIGVGTSLYIRNTHLDEVPEEVTPLGLLRYAEAPMWLAEWYGGIVHDGARRAELVREVTAAARLSPESHLLANVVLTVAEIDPPLGVQLGNIIDAARSPH